MAWWLVWATLHTVIIHNAGIAWSTALADSAVSNLLLMTLCFALSYTLRYYRLNESRSLYLIAWVMVLAGLWLWAVQKILGLIYAPDKAYLDFLSATLLLRYCIGLVITGCFMLLYWVWYYINNRHEDENRRAAIEKLARETELITLRQQLQPHFLFNTLNSISALAGSRPEEARKMIQQLSDFLRGTLRKEDRQLVSFADELHHLQLYLDIEKVRFGHRLNTQIEYDESSSACRLPSLILQPVVENAVKFGLYDTTEAVIIKITAKCEANDLVIIIENPFDPVTAKPKKGTGFGLSSVKRRLYLIFGRSNLFTTETNDNIFKAIIKIPQQ